MRKYEDSLPLKLLKAREAAMSFFRPMLQEHSITEQQWRVMRVLNDTDEMETKQLADACCILSPSLTGIIQRLEQQDYVSRRKSSEDHRRILVKATPKARKLLDEMTPMVENSYSRLTEGLSQEKMERLKELLDEVSLLTN
ncbi:homoprotocatechuate degradation operon regulator HpaR [Endozoicomonas sp. ALD040]|uniref:homoprotocatechuate degradation operon regulator HpaR n=1 Tax=unclassified Endozoicomonas TaxID=2644528 RepID=UPI003BB1D50B